MIRVDWNQCWGPRTLMQHFNATSLDCQNPPHCASVVFINHECCLFHRSISEFHIRPVCLRECLQDNEQGHIKERLCVSSSVSGEPALIRLALIGFSHKTQTWGRPGAVWHNKALKKSIPVWSWLGKHTFTNRIKKEITWMVFRRHILLADGSRCSFNVSQIWQGGASLSSQWSRISLWVLLEQYLETNYKLLLLELGKKLSGNLSARWKPAELLIFQLE